MISVQENHPLARYCTFQIGGPADFFLEATSVEELLEGIEWAETRDLPLFVFGGGSNLLFDDAGFRGLAIRVRANEIRVEDEDIFADAGVMASNLVQAAADAELTGLEAWSGLPGTVGGAVYGNAGCFGVETKDILVDAEIYVPGEGVKKVDVKDLGYSYRTSRLKNEGGIVLRARFRLEKGSGISEKMKEVAKQRIQKQPPGMNTGSFFKNPSADQPAGLLIDQAGLKGFVLGKMQVSEQHGNFFLNKGGASAQDVMDLAAHVRAAVEEKHGIRLEREIIFVPAA